jgi:S1-C subfamily serine protease
MFTSLMVVAVSQSTIRAADGEPGLEPIDPAQVIRQFTDQLVKLRSDGHPVDLARIQEQLPAEKTCEIEPLPPTEQPNAPPQLYETCRKGVVLVGVLYKCGKCDKWHSSVATGFVIRRDGVVVTNHHVLARVVQDGAIGVGTWDGRVIAVREVLAASEDNDLAVIQVDADDLTPLPLAPLAPTGTEVFVIGHPTNHLYMMTAGIVSGHYRRKMTSQGAACSQMTITADFAKGSSGSPVLDRTGAVVGIVRSTTPIYYEKKDGVDTKIQMVMKYCIPSTALLELLGPAKDECEPANTVTATGDPPA